MPITTWFQPVLPDVWPTSRTDESRLPYPYGLRDADLAQLGLVPHKPRGCSHCDGPPAARGGFEHLETCLYSRRMANRQIRRTTVGGRPRRGAA